MWAEMRETYSAIASVAISMGGVATAAWWSGGTASTTWVRWYSPESARGDRARTHCRNCRDCDVRAIRAHARRFKGGAQRPPHPQRGARQELGR